MLRTYVKVNLAKTRLSQRLKDVVKGEAGATVSEYALVLALVTVAVITALGTLGSAISNKLTDLAEQLGTP